jgi:xanthine dehydrogenase accessory factor
MREICEEIAQWAASGSRFAAATLVELREAKTAPLGTTIALGPDGAIWGNIGAGCYETEIVEAMTATAADGITRTLDINLDQDDELLGGTACGAVMRVVAWRPDRAFIPIAQAISTGDEDVDLHVAGYTFTIAAKSPLYIVGATSLAQELCAIGRRADFRVTVVDPRRAFATPQRLPDADAIVLAWPDEYLPDVLDERSSVVVLSHDPKLDIPALVHALRSPAVYVGLLGSRRAQASRRQALRAAGIPESALERLRGPVGLDLGGVTPAETAVSILSELIAVRRGRSAVPLKGLVGTIH